MLLVGILLDIRQAEHWQRSSRETLLHQFEFRRTEFALELQYTLSVLLPHLPFALRIEN